MSLSGSSSEDEGFVKISVTPPASASEDEVSDVSNDNASSNDHEDIPEEIDEEDFETMERSPKTSPKQEAEELLVSTGVVQAEPSAPAHVATWQSAKQAALEDFLSNIEKSPSKHNNPLYNKTAGADTLGLLKSAYLNCTYTRFSPVSMVLGVDEFELDVLKYSNVDNIGDLARFDKTEQYKTIRDDNIFASVPLLVSRAKRLLEMLGFTFDLPTDAEQISSASLLQEQRQQQQQQQQQQQISDRDLLGLKAKTCWDTADLDDDTTDNNNSDDDSDDDDDDNSSNKNNNNNNNNNDVTDKAAVTHAETRSYNPVQDIPTMKNRGLRDDDFSNFMPPQEDEKEEEKVEKEEEAPHSEWYLKPEYRSRGSSPDSSVAVLWSVNDKDMSRCLVHGIVTVRHLHESLKDLMQLAPAEKGHLTTLYTESSALMAASAAKLVATLPNGGLPMQVFHYVSEAVYQQIVEEKMLKSAYILFNEYMNCSASDRIFHAWKRVHHAYLRDTAKWMGKRTVDLSDISDADVFAFLVWRAGNSFGQFDCTAGPKAIYFTWTAFPRLLRENAIAIDQVIAEDTRDPFISDRYSRVIKINLSKLHSVHNGKIFRAEFSQQDAKQVDTNHWLPTTLNEVWSMMSGNSEKQWEHFEAGESYFGHVPHGCIVMNRGCIPFDCIELEEESV